MVADVKTSPWLPGAVLALLPVFCIPQAAAEEAVVAPSGLELTLQEVILEEALGRFRFVAPGIGSEGFGYMEVREDFPWICAEMIVPALAEAGQAPAEVVISLADREVTFGEMTPEATQYFEVFRLENGTCAWEQF